jgi:glutaconate CoA-transferase subunit B
MVASQKTVNYTPTEMMVKAAADQMEDNTMVFVGVGATLLAILLAQKTRCPHIISLYEGGILRSTPVPDMPFLIDDPVEYCGADYCADMTAAMGFMYRGEVDVAFLSGSQIDKYGNVNSTFIGTNYEAREGIMRMGSGGANDGASFCRRVIVVMPQQKRKFAKRVDYITSPGYIDGPGAREKAGLSPGTGPYCCISTMGVFKYDELSKEMYLEAYFPGYSPEDVKRETSWDLKISPKVYEYPPPSAEELKIMRELDPAALWRGVLPSK